MHAANQACSSGVGGLRVRNRGLETLPEEQGWFGDKSVIEAEFVDDQFRKQFRCIRYDTC